jgi:hypothetical protein
MIVFLKCINLYKIQICYPRVEKNYFNFNFNEEEKYDRYDDEKFIKFFDLNYLLRIENDTNDPNSKSDSELIDDVNINNNDNDFYNDEDFNKKDYKNGHNYINQEYDNEININNYNDNENENENNIDNNDLDNNFLNYSIVFNSDNKGIIKRINDLDDVNDIFKF